MTFWDIAAGEHPHRLGAVVTGHFKRLDQRVNILVDLFRVDEEAKAAILFRVDAVRHNIFSDGQVCGAAVDHAVL